MRLPRRLVPALVTALALLAPSLQAEPLRLCFENKDARPWRSAEGDGLDFNLLREVAQRLDLQIEFIPLPWKRCLAQLQTNAVDGAFSVSWTPSRAGIGVFPGGATPDESKRMHTASYLLVRKKGGALQWDGKRFSNLQGGRVGYQLGYSVGEHLDALRVPKEELNMAPADILRRVLAGQLVGAAVFASDLESLAKGPLFNQVDVLQPPFMSKAYYLVLSRHLVQTRPQRASQIWNAIENVRAASESSRPR